MNQLPSFAEIILPLPMRQSYTFRLPEELKQEILPGKRVIVQFGARKLYTGLVWSLHNETPEAENIKDVLAILDDDALIDPLQMKFWEWMAGYYMCTLGEVFKAALPSGLKLESESKLLVNDSYDASGLSGNNEELIYNIISGNNSLSIDDLIRITGKKEVHRELKGLMERGAVYLEEKLKNNYKPRKELRIALPSPLPDNDTLSGKLDLLSGAPKQKQLFEEVLRLSGLEEGKLVTKDLSFTNLASAYGAGTLNSLIRKGYLDKFEKETDRFSAYNGYSREPFQLDENQLKAFDEIRTHFESKKVVLLHGVTSSGKTEIYIHLIKKVFDEGRQVLYLLPEIALTSQIVSRLKEVFGDDIGVYHSRFSDSERVEVYLKLKQGKKDRIKMIIGVRSAIFLPFEDLGLIIVDEEHENTFKQFDPAPRYHARDASIILASFHDAKVLLGTATPSVESYTNCKNGKYGLVKLDKRFGNILMPEILVADVRKARLKGEMRSVFTPLLIRETEAAVSEGKQVILFQNRRGYSSFLECQQCGWIPRCIKCDVSLTYHKFGNHLNCHYCGYSVKVPAKCRECGSTSLITRGFGTELVEDEIELMLPGVRVGRLDLDSSRSRRAYEKILDDFGTGKLDILVGTQMLSKGLDFERVSLVGILNADQMLNFPDFRAFERSFQLMAQVSGRSGRKSQRGKVIIQSSDPSHPVIRYVISNNFESLYKDQVYERQSFMYPPFVRMIRFVVRSKDSPSVNDAVLLLSEQLRKIFGKRVLGPQPPLVGRVKNYYLQQIILKIEKKASFNKARMLIEEILKETREQEVFKKVRINIDVDPY